jgi:hypothetical protein
VRGLVVVPLAAAVAAGVLALSATAEAPPIGPLPTPVVTHVTTTKGSLVSIALLRRAGYDWRIAGALKASVLVEQTEGDVGPDVVLVFKAVGRGSATVTVAQTRGERPKAYRAVRYVVTVR